ncbi:hypothetical protein F5Y19DRAFT_246827 [Xylariaceae sp. FL1651]|nr:hypothetical protein F5Y19DRAFT_246827 [Xylariaceae sp. FL1651]
MPQHSATGWPLGQVGSSLEEGDVNSNDGGFASHMGHNTTPYLESSASHENQFQHLGYPSSASPYGQQSHGHYGAQRLYSNIGFGVENQPTFSHDVRPLGATQLVRESHDNNFQQSGVSYANEQNLNFHQFHTQEVSGHYPEFAQAQQHVGPNEFPRNTSWTESQSHHGSPSHYGHGQQVFSNNPALIRVATASPGHLSTSKPGQNAAQYQVGQTPTAYQPQAYSGAYQPSQSPETRQGYPSQAPISAAPVSMKSNANATQSPRPVSVVAQSGYWPSQGQAQTLGTVAISSAPTHTPPPSIPRPTTTEFLPPGPELSAPATTNVNSKAPVVFTYKTMKPEHLWTSVEGCPYMAIGVEPVQRQMLKNATTVKPHIAGDNKNGTRLLPLRPEPLPCEILRDKLKPMVKRSQALADKIKVLGKQNTATQPESEERKRIAEELRKLEVEKISLDNDIDTLTGKGAASKSKKQRVTGKSETAEVDSESFTESSEEEDPLEDAVRKIMATKTRPTDPFKRVEYDVVRILRQENDTRQSGTTPGEKEAPWSKLIGRRVAEFGKYVVEICAEARTLREQKSKAPKSQSSQLQEAIDQKYGLVCAALQAALDFGDDETLRNMGKHEKLMSGLTVALSRQFANKNYNTTFPRIIIRFMSQATLMDLDVFHKVKLSTVLEKHGDNLDEMGKKLVAQIVKNAEERTAKNIAEKPTAVSQPKQKPIEHTKESRSSLVQKTSTAANKSTGTVLKPQAQLANTAISEPARKETKAYSGLVSARKVSNNIAKASVVGSPTKRPRDEDADSRAAKKVAVETTAGAPGTGRTVSASFSGSVTPQNAVSNTGQTRPRASGSTVLNKSRAAPKPPTKKAESQPSVSLSISGLLAEIAKPAEKPKPQEQPVKLSETAEEKTRRLRKESRRGRTVMWKPDDELVQIRFFEHDSTEDEGRASNMIRDARDNRLEGQMLKQMQRNMQDGDDEDEDGNPTESDIRPWVAPRVIDYSPLDQDQRARNYVTRGGVREVDSEQKKVMEAYENRELMSIYTTLSEIPESPRSPPKKPSEPFIQPRNGFLPRNNPQAHEIQRRWTESTQFGTTTASHFALQRLGISPSNVGTSHSTNHAAAYINNAALSASLSQSTTGSRMMTQEERDALVLALLTSNKAKNYIDPDSYDPAQLNIVQPPASEDSKIQRAFEIIQGVTDQYKNMPFPPTEPPQWLQSDPDRVQEWYTGYNYDIATKAKREATERAAKFVEEHARRAAEGAQGHYSAPEVSQLAAYQTQQQSQRYQQLPQQVPDQYAAILQQVQALQNPQAAQVTVSSQLAPTQPDNGLHNLLATLGHSTQSAPATTQGTDYAAWQAWAQSQAQSYGTQPQVQSQSQGYPYTQQYDGASSDEQSYGSNQQGYQSHTAQSQGQHQRDRGERGNRKDFHRVTKDEKGINRALIGTKPCSFWAKGQCAKGDKCTFRHDPNDLK